MILSADTLRRLQPVQPFCERTVHRGMSYGVSLCGYDVRVNLTNIMGAQRGVSCVHSPQHGPGVCLDPGAMMLAATVEKFNMPLNAAAIVHDKSTWARRGLCIPNVVLEPGWKGFLTLQLHNRGGERLSIFDGDPIAQILFHALDEALTMGYTGKYQGQGPAPTPARDET